MVFALDLRAVNVTPTGLQWALQVRFAQFVKMGITGPHAMSPVNVTPLAPPAAAQGNVFALRTPVLGSGEAPPVRIVPLASLEHPAINHAFQQAHAPVMVLAALMSIHVFVSPLLLSASGQQIH